MHDKTKQESWVRLAGWVEEKPDNIDWAPWKAFILPLLRSCVDAGIDQYFRVGQSMSDIIFSNTEQHGLENYEPPPPRVTLRFDRAKRQWFIAWSYRFLISGEPDRKDPVNAENAFSVLKSYLADLWRETRPNETVPVPFATRG
jgi:hypothetical protein